MATRLSGQKADDAMKSGGNNFTKGAYVDLTPDKSTGRKETKLRLIGMPIAFFQCNEFQSNPDKTDRSKPNIKVAFPDIELNKSPVRVCHDDKEQCFWTQKGYVRQARFAQVCIDRADGIVKILAKGKMIFGSIRKEENDNMAENIELAAQEEELLWTCAGGLIAPDLRIVSESDPKALGGVKYTVNFLSRSKKVTDEEIEKLRELYAPTAEELEKICDEDPDAKNYPDWYYYGYPLERMFSYTAPKTEEANSSEEEIDMSKDDEEDEVPAPKVVKSNKVVQPVKDEDEDEDEVPAPKATKSNKAPVKHNDDISLDDITADEEEEW